MENEENLSAILKKAYECFYNKKYDKALILFNFLNSFSQDDIYGVNIKICHMLLQQIEKKRLLSYKEDKFYKPKVSIIVTSYNNGIYLEECLKSIANQTLKDIEVICVDDCSTDGSQNVIKQYQKEIEHFICIFHDQNMSASQVRKDGLLKSRGEYVMFVDGDDALEENACEIAYNTISSQKTDMVHFGTIINNVAKVSESRINANLRMVKPYIGLLKKIDVVENCWVHNKFKFQIWNKIYNGNIARLAASNIEDGYYPKANDLYLFFLIASFSTSYFGIETPLYIYNFGIGSTGGDSLPTDKYKTIVKECDIVNLLKTFCDSFYITKYETIVDSIEKSFINECFCKWRDFVEPKDRSACFRYLCEAFGFQKIIIYLTTKHWDKRIEISKLLLNVEYFRHVNINKKRKTIVSYYRSIKNGGAQRVVAMLCNRWAEMVDEDGNPLYNIVLAIDNYPEQDEYPLSEKVQRVFLHNRIEYIKDKYEDRLYDWHNIIEKYDVDVVVNSLWLDTACYWDMLAVKGHPKHPAYVIHAHNTCTFPFLSATNVALDISLRYRLCDGVVALSQADETYIKSFNKNVKYIVNPISFNPHEIKKSSYNKNTIIWCGRISSEKRPMHAVMMMKHVVGEIQDAKLLIVGDGSKRILNEMQDLCKELNLSNNIEFIGFTNDVSKYYSQASVFICTSEYEGFPLTIGEALAHSLPVVSYDMPYLSYMLDGRGIAVVPQGDFASMAHAVVDLLNDNDKIRSIGQESFNHIVDIYNTDIENDWKHFFDSIENNVFSQKKRSIYELLFEEITKAHDIGRNKSSANATQTNPQASTNEMLFDYNKNPMMRFVTARIDIKNIGNEANDIEIYDVSNKYTTIKFNKYWSDKQGNAYIVESNYGNVYFKIKCINNGKLKFVLRGVNCKEANNTKQEYIKYNVFEINSNKIIKEAFSVSYDKTYQYECDVTNGKELAVQINWLPA